MEASRLEPPPVLDDATFDHLVRTHRSPLERYARSLGASPEDAEEIAATALLRAYQHPPVARHEQEWRAWLSTVTQNLWIDARRRRQLRLVAGDGVLEAVPSAGGFGGSGRRNRRGGAPDLRGDRAAAADAARGDLSARGARAQLRGDRGRARNHAQGRHRDPAPRTGRGAAPPWRNRTGAGGRGDLARQSAPPGRERSAPRDGVGNERRRPDRAPGRPRGGSGRGGDRRPAHARRHAAHASTSAAVAKEARATIPRCGARRRPRRLDRSPAAAADAPRAAGGLRPSSTRRCRSRTRRRPLRVRTRPLGRPAVIRASTCPAPTAMRRRLPARRRKDRAHRHGRSSPNGRRNPNGR